MTENYIQYAEGYQKDNIDEKDIIKAIKDIQLIAGHWLSEINTI